MNIEQRVSKHTGTRLLDLTHNVSHPSLVAKEGSEVAFLGLVISGEGLHCNEDRQILD